MISLFGDAKPWRFDSLKKRLLGSTFSFLYLLLAVSFLSLWHLQLTHIFSLRVFAVFMIVCGLSLVYGRLFIKLSSLSFSASSGLSIQFLLGYFVLNTILFALSLATPFTIGANAALLVAGGLLVALFCPGLAKNGDETRSYLPHLLCLLVSGIGATLWCGDSLSPPASTGQDTIYQMWYDCFFHARQISAFSQAHGLRNLSDILLSGAPAPMYHYASYAMPAAVLVFTRSSAYEVLASFMLPFGIFLTGIAAFSLTASIWGAWPGLAATIAVILLPDAYQQGFGNKFLSYNFWQQAVPGGLYGVLCVTIAWIFILDACKSGKFASIFIGYIVTIVSLAYRAHFFVANAFLIMIYPCIFFTRIRASWRFVVAVLLVTLFVFVAVLSERSPAIPTLRLDGSGIKQYALELLSFYDVGFFKSFFTRALSAQQSGPIFELNVVGMIVMSTFGLWSVAYVVISVLVKARVRAAAFFLPLCVLANYIIMFLGLALDKKKIGGPDELLHRPFVWAYFVIVAWTGAGIYAFLIGNRPPRSYSAIVGIVIVVVSTLAIPFAFARNIQTMPAWKGCSSYREINSVPSGLVKACLYLRQHSGVEDIIWDSGNDPRFVVTALAERQDYAVEGAYGRAPKGLRERLDELAAFRRMGCEEKLAEFVKTHRISWCLLRPTSVVVWPASFLGTSVFNSGGYRVYHFTR